MSVKTGANIVTENLVVNLDQNNLSRGYLGEATTNLVSNPSFSAGVDVGYADYGSTLYSAYSDSVPTSLGINRKVCRIITSSSVSGGGNYGGILWGGSTPTVGNPATISFYARAISGTGASIVVSNQSGSGDNSNLSGEVTSDLSKEWTRYSISVASYNASKPTFFIWCGNKATFTYEIADIQIEEKDHPTRFIEGSRDNNGVMKDLGSANSTVNVFPENVFPSDGYFSQSQANGGGLAITDPDLRDKDYTISSWVNCTDVSVRNPISGDAQYSWSFVEISAGGQFQGYHRRTYGQEGGAGSGAYRLQNNTWYNVVYTFSLTDGAKAYVNGVLYGHNPSMTYGYTLAGRLGNRIGYTYYGGPSTVTRFNGTIAEYSIYAEKALSLEEVKQNFNAKRHIYGV